MTKFQWKTGALMAAMMAAFNVQAAQDSSSLPVFQTPTIHVNAEHLLKNSLGSSLVTSADIERTPVRDDISEIVSTLPGVNLTGNSAAGQRGNNRQIDIRGMGPENTLILIDGRPVTSRNSVRYSWRGERDTRGDSNWVPAEAIQSIEVIRGPSAARYGSGAMGGVVNIHTKPVTDYFYAWGALYGSLPQHSDEGKSYRVGAGFSTPLKKDVLGLRLFANYNHTDPDSPGINSSLDYEYGPVGKRHTKHAAGREGVVNTDVAARLALKVTPDQLVKVDAAWSRQSNIFAGDAQNSIPTPLVNTLANNKVETNRMTRTSVALSHEGHWGDALTHLSIDYAHTVNGRFPEGLIGGLEGKITKSQGFVNSTLNSLRFAGDWEDSFDALGVHVLTVGFEVTHDHLTDPGSNGLSLSIPQPNHKPPKVFNEDDWLKNNRSVSTSQTNAALYVEDHWKPIERLDIVPTLRFDHNTASGNNVSPGLSFSLDLAQHWRMKGGIARAYKAPNLYQSNPNYLLYSASNGCPLDFNGQSGCFLVGNKHLKPETSVNQEIGIEYRNSGYLASLTFFRNDYRNKIVAGTTRLNPSTAPYWVLQWSNAKKALVQGLEGNVTLPLLKTLKWTTNLTYMDKFVNKDTGNPLSIIPQFTLNTMLDWHVAPKWDVNLTVTQFGKRKARRFVENKMENEQPIFKLSHHDVKPYAIASVSASYQIVPQAKLRLGIYNLFDKRILRSPDVSSAQTFNQPGRAFYAHLQLTY